MYIYMQISMQQNGVHHLYIHKIPNDSMVDELQVI